MTPILHLYNRQIDFQRVGDFLIRHYQSDNRDGNWFQPIWEYMHSHTMLDASSLDKIGVWEEAGEIAAVVHYESTLGEVFFETTPTSAYLRPHMLAYAEQHLYGTRPDGTRYVQAFVNDFDPPFEALVTQHGYALEAYNHRPMARFIIPHPFPPIPVAPGFRLRSLQEDNNLLKFDRVLWRGFNHPGEPPEDGPAGRLHMESVPGFDLSLKIFAEAPDGNWASFCGMWYDAANRLAYVEPVATDPTYRRLGLGKAVVLEGIRRCAELGATLAYVGSDQEFYKAIGFNVIYTSRSWLKNLPY